jgi:hypothetical protein
LWVRRKWVGCQEGGGEEEEEEEEEGVRSGFRA